jgi:hypothetical protein
MLPYGAKNATSKWMIPQMLTILWDKHYQEVNDIAEVSHVVGKALPGT